MACSVSPSLAHYLIKQFGVALNILFIGDIVGRPGRHLVRDALPQLVDQHVVDLVVANAENAAAGFGLTPDVVAELFDIGIDVERPSGSDVELALELGLAGATSAAPPPAVPA